MAPKAILHLLGESTQRSDFSDIWKAVARPVTPKTGHNPGAFIEALSASPIDGRPGFWHAPGVKGRKQK
jgi:hypothetical protein